MSAAANPIVVTPGAVPPPSFALQLANALVAAGGGVTVNSAAYTGVESASGFFSGGGDVIGIETGILLTSGAASFVVGPNNSNATIDTTAPGDAQLSAIVGLPTNDAS